MNAAYPDFYILGAPKCGTTALYTYLREHPAVFMPRIKEPHFFCTDLGEHRWARTEEEYLRMFQAARPEHRAVGEASIFYLYSQESAPNILEVRPDAKFIVMLRDPVEMLYSLHSQYLYALVEDEEDFESAWRLRGQRRSGQLVPQACRSAKLLDYEAIGRFSEQVGRVQSLVSPENLCVLLFDDFKRSPHEQYRKVLAFLGLPDDGRSHFPRVNMNKRSRVPLLTTFLMAPPFPLNRLKQRLKNQFRIRNHPLSCWIYGVLSQRVRRKPLSAHFRSELAETFRADIEALQKMLNRDLAAWVAPCGSQV